MILQREIAEVAERLRVNKSTIDKDWVLGHFINALYGNESLNEHLVFKGGTCLRKCYFENYRFSEDLDFTVAASDFRFSHDVLQQICTVVESQSGIRTHIQKLEPLVSNGQPTGFQADVKFWGADHPRNQAPLPPDRWQTRIKIDVILYEEMRFEAVRRPLLHPYSDREQLTATPRCYAINEVLAEKLRALVQRKYTAPRDYYDLWYLSRTDEMLDWPVIVAAFHRKMAFKGLAFEGPRQLLNDQHHKTLTAHWQQTLVHQVPVGQLPALPAVLTELEHLFLRIF